MGHIRPRSQRHVVVPTPLEFAAGQLVAHVERAVGGQTQLAEFQVNHRLVCVAPGVALTMGVRDILNGDYLSGSIRLLDALLIAGSIAGGVVLGWIMARGLGVA